MLIVFDDTTADMKTKRKVSPTVTELFLRGRKLNNITRFISQYYFKMAKTIRLNATHFLIMKIANKRGFQQIASNHSSAIEFQVFMKLSFLVNDGTLSSDKSSTI